MVRGKSTFSWVSALFPGCFSVFPYKRSCPLVLVSHYRLIVQWGWEVMVKAIGSLFCYGILLQVLIYVFDSVLYYVSSSWLC